MHWCVYGIDRIAGLPRGFDTRKIPIGISRMQWRFRKGGFLMTIRFTTLFLLLACATWGAAQSRPAAPPPAAAPAPQTSTPAAAAPTAAPAPPSTAPTPTTIGPPTPITTKAAGPGAQT